MASAEPPLLTPTGNNSVSSTTITTSADVAASAAGAPGDEGNPSAPSLVIENGTHTAANTDVTLTVDGVPTPPPVDSAPSNSMSIGSLVWKGLRSVTVWTIFGIITTFFFTVPSGLSGWMTLVDDGGGSEGDAPSQRSGHLDPAVAMVCLESAEHPIVRQSGQCADISLSDLEALDMESGKLSARSSTFEDFAIVRKIPRTQFAFSEARKWPPRSVGPWVQYPVLATDVPGSQPGAGRFDAAAGHYYKEWATQVRELYIPITHYIFFHDQESMWRFESAAAFFRTRGIFDVWDEYLFSLASISQDPDCLDCLHAPVPLVSLKHPYNITLQRKEDDNPLLHLEELDCEELYRRGSNQYWRHECLWPEVYQNFERSRKEGYLDREPPLNADELGKVVREEGWSWRPRP